MTKLDWSKAKPKPPTERHDNGRTGNLRQSAMANFVARHRLACFKCGTRSAKWAKTGFNGRGPWAVCVNCIRR